MFLERSTTEVSDLPLNCCAWIGDDNEKVLKGHFRLLRDRDKAYCTELESSPACYMVERVFHRGRRNVVGTGKGMHFADACKMASRDAVRKYASSSH